MANETTNPRAPAPVRQIVSTGIMTEFGELVDDPEGNAKQGPNVDICYTPGFSEMRWQRDTELAEVARGERAKQDVSTLPVNVRLVRRSNTAGQPDMTKQMQSGNKGYRHITKDDVGKPWFTEIPPGATQLADGTIAKGDCVYMVCDQQQAARNAYQKDRLTRRRLTGAAERAESAGVRYESEAMTPLRGAPPSKINVT